MKLNDVLKHLKRIKEHLQNAIEWSRQFPSPKVVTGMSFADVGHQLRQPTENCYIIQIEKLCN